jgi:alkylated DNA repair dioxygenase AlkB
VYDAAEIDVTEFSERVAGFRLANSKRFLIKSLHSPPLSLHLGTGSLVIVPTPALMA